MSERYYVTGVQLGMLVALNDRDGADARKTTRDILESIEEQFVCNVSSLSEHDQETVDRTLGAIFFKAFEGHEPTDEELDKMMAETSVWKLTELHCPKCDSRMQSNEGHTGGVDEMLKCSGCGYLENYADHDEKVK